MSGSIEPTRQLPGPGHADGRTPGRCGLFEVLNPTNPWSGVVVGFGFFDLFGFDEVALSQW
jgi:hypothetical protein